MKKLTKSLVFKMWICLTAFALVIIFFIWAFQVLLLDEYYEYRKTNIINEAASLVLNIESIEYNELPIYLDNVALEYEVCIEITKTNSVIYSSNAFGVGCIIGSDIRDETTYKEVFVESGEFTQSYKVINQKYDINTLVKAINIGDTYIYINATLEPTSETKDILSEQLSMIIVIISFISFIISFYISKKISSPILKINKFTKNLSTKTEDLTLKTDITELLELEDTLNKAADELKRTEELRRDLMANVSHDLKTPLTMISAYAEMIKDISYKNKTKREEHLNIIIDESNRLSLLVNDILELSLLQTNDLIDITDFNLYNLINEIITNYEILKEKENYKFVIKCDKSIEVKADRKRIYQVIYNLVNNAINYVGEDKTVTIEVINNKKNVLVKIIDTGRGISKKDISHIWDRYYKNKKLHQRNAVGTGLGLSIVKNILEKHNVNYGVDSEKNKGTTFYFELIKNDK